MNANISKEIKAPLFQNLFSSSRRTDEVPSRNTQVISRDPPTQNAEEMRCYLWR